MQLTTDRLILREIVFEDSAVLHANSQHPEARHYEEHPPLTPAEFEDITRWMIDMQQTQPRTHYYFAIVLPDNPTYPIGSIYLTIHDAHNRQAETGYILAVPQWGNGYTTEALREMLRFGFEDLICLFPIWLL
ncbi:MAG: GNAT family N-acetyltransferase [Aggregatilineales bacterium]